MQLGRKFEQQSVFVAVFVDFNDIWAMKTAAFDSFGLPIAFVEVSL